MYLEYAGQKRPRTDAVPLYKTSAVAPEDYTVARWLDSMVQTGGFFRSGGAETVQDWHARGAYYHFTWPKEGADRSSRVILSYAFTQAIDQASILLFEHYRRLARVRVENGEVVEVRVQDQ